MKPETVKALAVIWIAIALMVATWLNPPWIHSPKAGHRDAHITFPTKWAPLWDARQGEYEGKDLVYRIDFQRLILWDATIFVLAAGVLATLRLVRR